MIVRPDSRIVSAISFGVFWREAPSTSAIIRSRKVSPGFAVIRMMSWSDSTLVPPVTAERSPPDSRMTGADSPVIADSSTDATPSIDLAVSRDHVARSADHDVAARRTLDATVSTLAGIRRVSRSRLAWVCRRVLRSSSAWALPRPSAIASAKFANSTVNQSHSASCRMNPSRRAPRASSRTSTTVVNTLPTSTTNMTGFRTMWRGASLTNESRRPADDGRVEERPLGDGHTRRASRLHEQMFDDRAERPAPGRRSARRRSGSTPMRSTTKSGVVTGNVPADSGAMRFSARKPAAASIGTCMANRPISVAKPNSVL